MKKKVRQIEIIKPYGTFNDILELYKWLGKIRLSSDQFDIDVKIKEYKEITDVEED